MKRRRERDRPRPVIRIVSVVIASTVVATAGIAPAAEAPDRSHAAALAGRRLFTLDAIDAPQSDAPSLAAHRSHREYGADPQRTRPTRTASETHPPNRRAPATRRSPRAAERPEQPPDDRGVSDKSAIDVGRFQAAVYSARGHRYLIAGKPLRASNARIHTIEPLGDGRYKIRRRDGNTHVIRPGDALPERRRSLPPR